MIDTSVLAIIVAVAVIAVIVYAVERYTKQKPIEWTDASKVGLLSGAGAGGLVFALGGDGESVAATVASATAAAQDMFVGKPSF
jgi:hypothetical protein